LKGKAEGYVGRGRTRKRFGKEKKRGRSLFGEKRGLALKKIKT